MNKNTKKVCKNVTLTLSVLLTSCGGGGGGGTPGHAISSEHLHNNPEVQVDTQNIEPHSIASETDKGEGDKDNHDLPSSNEDTTISSPTRPTANANIQLDEHLHNHTDEQLTPEIEVDLPKIEDNSLPSEKEQAEKTQDAVVSPYSPAPSKPKTDAGIHTPLEQELKSEVDAPKAETNSKESEKEPKKNHESSLSNEESVATPTPSAPEKKAEETQDNKGSLLPRKASVTSSPIPSTPNTNVDENINNHSEQEPNTKADAANVVNNVSESEKGRVEGMKDNNDLSSSNEGSLVSPSMPLASEEKVEEMQDTIVSPSVPSMPKTDAGTQIQPEQKPNAEIDSKAENNLMVPETDSVKSAEANSSSQPLNESSSHSSQIVSKRDKNASSDHFQLNSEAKSETSKVGDNSLVLEEDKTSEPKDNGDALLPNKGSMESAITSHLTDTDVENSEEKSKTEVTSSKAENNSAVSKEKEAEETENNSVPTVLTHSSHIVSTAEKNNIKGKSDTPENKPATPINNMVSEQNPKFKGNFLGVEEEKRPDLYYSDESKIYHVGIVDTFFYDSKNFKKTNDTSRLVHVNQKDKHDEDKHHHGTMVAQTFVKNNKLSDIYAESISNGTQRVFVTDEGTFHLPNVTPNLQAYENLYQKGVKIFNSSYGTPWSEHGAVSNYLEKLAEYAGKDSIFVWAAGNAKKEQASLEAHYPEKKTQAKNGWIAVAALEDDTPQSGKKLAEYSNKVGDKVKDWGIAAQGNWAIDLPGEECSPRNYYGCTRHLQGTSLAAPTVSATVANVWNKFPWMDNHLVVVTVLSTANKPTDRDQTEGPDATFGWGILNNDRALSGPGRFDKRLLTDRDTDNLLTVNLRNMHYTDTNKLTWANPIAGDAGIRKKGNGTLYFTGVNSYQGNTVIEEGAIQISKPLTKSKVEIKSSGEFIVKNHNSMVTVGNDEQKSTYELQNNGGTLGVYGKGLEIKGHYKGQNGAKVAIDIDQAKLKVNGTLDIGEKGYIVADVENILLLNSQSSKENVIVEADKIEHYKGEYKISSEAAKYINIEDFTATDKQVKVKYKRNTTTYVFKEMDYTPTVSEVNAGKILDTHLDDLSEKAEKNPTALSADTSRSVARIMNADNVELPKMVKSLSGEIYASSQNIFVKQNRLFNHTLSSRIASLMSAEKSGVWLDSLNTKYNLHQAGYSQGNVTTTGTQIGIDGKLSRNLTLGVTFFKGKSSAQFGERVGNIESKSSSLSLYGSYDFNQFYLSGRLGGSRMNNNIKRDVIDQRVESSYQSKVYNLYAELGKLLQLGNMSINPFLAGEFSQISRGQFKENAEFGIRSDKTNYNQKHVVAGLRGMAKLERIHLMVNLSHSFELDAQNFNFGASFKDSERKVNIKGVKQSKQSTFAELGISYELSKQFTLQSKYSLTMQGAKKENNVFNLGAVYYF